MEEEKVNIILREIIGNDLYNDLIHEAGFYFINDSNCRLNKDMSDIEPILNACCTAILLIGISKKPVNIRSYIIHLSKERKIKINTEDLCRKFEKYIVNVENFKFKLLKEIS